MQENQSSVFLTRFDTNQPVQPQKNARSFKFIFRKKRNGTIDVANTADLRLCFRIGNNPVFSQRGSYNLSGLVVGHRTQTKRSGVQISKAKL